MMKKAANTSLRRHRFLAKMILCQLLAVSGTQSAAGDDFRSVTTPAGRTGCNSLASPRGKVVKVSTVAQLVSAVKKPAPGSTILLEEGIYNLEGVSLALSVPEVTVRSASGDREAVVLDGNFKTKDILQIYASKVTIADLTLRNAYHHPIHVMSTSTGDTLHTRILNVHIIDPGEQAIKINPTAPGHYADYGTVACSHLELTDAGRPRIRNSCYTGGIDAHQAKGWSVRDNVIEGFWCPEGLSEHAIHFWKDSQDTVVERNTLRNNVRGIGFGLEKTGKARIDSKRPDGIYYDHVGGIIRNNFVSADDSRLFSTKSGFDCGICLWQANNVQVLHNTVFSTDSAHTFSSIDVRFAGTSANLLNNLVNVEIKKRAFPTVIASGNLTNAKNDWFVDAASGDLHLRTSAIQAIDQVVPSALVAEDRDRDPRPRGKACEVGADEL